MLTNEDFSAVPVRRPSSLSFAPFLKEETIWLLQSKQMANIQPVKQGPAKQSPKHGR